MNASSIVTAAGLAALLAFSMPAFADGKQRDARPAPPAPPAFEEECGSCHIAYPARFLPAQSWTRMMASLEDHFGTDASIAPEQRAEIEKYLVAAARKLRSGEQPPDRITTTRWFKGEHDDVTGAQWRLEAVGSPANCGACHQRAAEGSFRERDIRIPKGGQK